MNRRNFLTTTLGTTAFAFSGLQKLLHAGEVPDSAVIDLYGSLVKDPKGLLDLPQGFSYSVVSKTGDKMDDGFRVPGKPDGMATFDGKDGRVILLRNHELGMDANEIGPFPHIKDVDEHIDLELAHNAEGMAGKPFPGGTSTVVYNPQTGKVEKQFLSLIGTDRNCAGGAMPWGSWITCEETAKPAEEKFRNHGYCFEVKASDDGVLQKAVPLKALGRFRHEAVALDPESRVLYLTEDRGDGLIYRFVPDKADDFTAGKLQALGFVEKGLPDTRNYESSRPNFPVGVEHEIRWIDLEDIDSPKDDLRHRGRKAGASYFARGEGITWNDGALYICCTNGGNKRQGQIFKLTPGRDGAADSMSLFLQPGQSDLLANGDNLCTGHDGHMFVCEDLVEEHAANTPHVRGVTPEGKIYSLGRNALNRSEFAGTCWHEGSQTLFVNIQNPGITLAIQGPWKVG